MATMLQSSILSKTPLSFGQAVSGEAVTVSKVACLPALTRRTMRVEASTRIVGQSKVIEVFGDKKGSVRSLGGSEQAAPKILKRVQELRLLSKLESAGLLTAIEKAGLSLSKIEKLGLLSKAEDLGVLSAATNRDTPGALLALGAVLLASGPAAVYLIPEDSTVLVALQAVIVGAAVVGGAAAVVGSNLIKSLQKE